MNATLCWKVTLVLACVFLVSGCDNSTDSADSAPPLRLVKTLNISLSHGNQWRELPGVVDAARKADLNFRTAGKLQKILVNEGDEVKTGQLLAQLDATDLNIQLRSRKAEYQQVHADYSRSKALVKKGVISRSDFNKLQAQNVTAKSNLSTAEQNVKYTFLRAPFEGRVAKRHVENFEEVSASQAIFSLQDPNTLTIKVGVPESVMVRAKNRPPSLSAEFATLPGERFPLSLKEVSTQADPDTNTFEVTLNMPELNGHNILPGMSATVRAERPADEVSAEDSPIYVPSQAVLEDTEGRFVYVVRQTSKGKGAVDRRPVTTGRLSGAGMEVLSGLEIGDDIVIAGMSKMYPGLEVRTGLENSQ